jgi:hypothetical protein
MPQRSDFNDPWGFLRVVGCKSVRQSEADGSLLDAVATREMKLGLEDNHGYGGLIWKVAVRDPLKLGLENGL